ncbi:MAG: phosphoribosylanthranilate isomerase [Clostridia bacterium]|nr:phosphoribosylanthranilate isomerase [Clostridia bacterium]
MAVKIKICGLREPAEAAYLNRNRVDMAGMVLFFPKSKRNISITQAGAIMEALDPNIRTVAVTVSPTPEQALEIQEAGFDMIQIHGVLDPEVLRSTEIPVIRAFNVDNMNEAALLRNNSRIGAYLFDAQTPGSGKTFDWSLISELPTGDKPVILAGGLNPSNVGAAVEMLSPYAVDVSSGVEKDGGGKDPDRIDAFVKAVRLAEDGSQNVDSQVKC